MTKPPKGSFLVLWLVLFGLMCVVAGCYLLFGVGVALVLTGLVLFGIAAAFAKAIADGGK